MSGKKYFCFVGFIFLPIYAIWNKQKTHKNVEKYWQASGIPSKQNIWDRDKSVFNSAVSRNTFAIFFYKILNKLCYFYNHIVVYSTKSYLCPGFQSLGFVAKDCFNQFFLCGVKCNTTICFLKRIILISLVM